MQRRTCRAKRVARKARPTTDNVFTAVRFFFFFCFYFFLSISFGEGCADGRQRSVANTFVRITYNVWRRSRAARPPPARCDVYRNRVQLCSFGPSPPPTRPCRRGLHGTAGSRRRPRVVWVRVTAVAAGPRKLIRPAATTRAPAPPIHGPGAVRLRSCEHARTLPSLIL